MMDREPFAVPEVRLHASENSVWGVSIDGTVIGHLSEEEANDRASIVNYSFDARVKEEVKKAVEEFRMQAVQDIKKFGELMAKDDWNKRVGASDLFEQISDGIAELVEKLPTETDGKPTKDDIELWHMMHD